MTLEQVINKARRLARVDSTGKLDSEVMDCVNESMHAFVKRVHDVTKSAYLQVTPEFNTSAFMAVSVEIIGGANAFTKADVSAEVAREGANGTDFAGYLTARLNAAIVAAGGAGTTTITWSTTEWKFTLDAGVGTTSISLNSPESIIYQDATPLIGCGGTQSGRYYYGTMPEDITKSVPLPDDFLAILGDPEWDGDPLTPGPRQMFVSPEIFGEPTRYFVCNSRLLLHPSPNRQGILRICYRYIATEFETVSGYQELGLTTAAYSSATGLSASTQYYFKVKVDSNTQVEYDITTGTDVTWGAVLALINAAISGAAFDIVESDVRCTSETEGKESAIALAAGTTGTDLFGALTGFTSFSTAVTPEYTTDIPLDDEYCMAIVHHVAGQLLEESFEVQLSIHHYGQFERLCSEYIVNRANQNTAIFPQTVKRNQWEVEPFAGS